MPRAVWKDTVIAETTAHEEVEGNAYFPPDAVNAEFLRPSTHRTTCPWKGEAHYYDVVVDGDVNANAAWYYPDPKPAAANIKDHVAFWRGVSVQ